MEEPAQPATFDDGRKIRLLHDEVGEYVNDIVQKFLSTLPNRLAILADAMAAHDLRAVQKEAHKLKGAAATLGADFMVQLCCQLEQQCQMGQLPPADLLTTLDANATDVVKEMNRILKSLRSG